MRVILKVELCHPICNQLVIPIGFASGQDAVRWLMKPDNHRLIFKIQGIYDGTRPLDKRTH